MAGDGFLVLTFVFLAAAVVVVPIVQRSRLGTVLGYLIAGVAIGPYGLRLVTNPEAILHFAEFGVVMMLFLIGLELQPSTLWRLRKPIVGMGGLQLALTAAAIMLLARLADFTWSDGLVIGLGLALSSTAIVLKILNERQQMQITAGQSAFSVLLFQDMAVIPILALLPLLGANEIADATFGEPDALPGWLQGLVIVGIVVGFVLAGRFLLRPIFRFIAATGVREIFTAFSLLLVVAISLLMQVIGLSAALGAFVAGVVLAESEYRHALEADIEPFKGLLLGLFFMSVGMSINFGVLAEHPLVVFGAVLGLIVVKFVLLAAIAWLFRMPLGQILLFAVVLAQGGEFAFVLFQFAAVEGALAQPVTEVLIVIVALSMAVTPLLLAFYERVVLPRLGALTAALPAHDDIDEPVNPVIIVGYGRFGQIVGRLLDASNVPTTVLDNDPDQIEVLRKFGQRVYYGDASRTELLKAAGIERARLIVLALDDPEKTVETAKLVRAAAPKMKILARARDRNHAYQLMAVGVDVIQRETFESALQLGRQVLVMLGYHPYAARQQAMAFARHDNEVLEEGFKVHEDESSLLSLLRLSSSELEELFESEQRERAESRGANWGGQEPEEEVT